MTKKNAVALIAKLEKVQYKTCAFKISLAYI